MPILIRVEINVRKKAQQLRTFTALVMIHSPVKFNWGSEHLMAFQIVVTNTSKDLNDCMLSFKLMVFKKFATTTTTTTTKSQESVFLGLSCLTGSLPDSASDWKFYQTQLSDWKFTRLSCLTGSLSGSAEFADTVNTFKNYLDSKWNFEECVYDQCHKLPLRL